MRTSPMLEAATVAATALRRIDQPNDIADAVAFLASDDARWITGNLLDVSGRYLPGGDGLSSSSADRWVARRGAAAQPPHAFSCRCCLAVKA